MKVRHVIFFIIVIIVAFGLVDGHAETIYTNDGKVIRVKIATKTTNTIWYEVQVGSTRGRVGIDVNKVSKILNDDGTISHYSPNYSEQVAKPKIIHQEEFIEQIGAGEVQPKPVPKPSEQKIKEAKASAAAGAGEWRTDLTDVPIPDINAQGLIHGRKFVCEETELQGNILTLRQGEGFFPDLALKIFLFLEEDEVLENKIYNIAKTDESVRAHIHIQWKPADSDMPETEIFMKDYAMRLEFGIETDGNIPGKIYICLPDEDKSVVAGRFEISADKKLKTTKTGVSQTTDDTSITPEDIEDLSPLVKKTVTGASTVLLILLIVSIIIVIAGFIFWLLMVIDCIKRVFPVPKTKIIWLLFLFVIGPLVAIIYYFAVKKKGQ